MEEFYDPPTINRAVVLVIPKKSFYDWAKAVFPDTDGIGALEEFNSYLIKDDILAQEPKKALRGHWTWIFENELLGACTDEDTWPKNRTWKLFNEWFELRFSSVVLDLLEGPVYRES